MNRPDPAQVAAEITGCEPCEDISGGGGLICWSHLGQPWPCRYLTHATEVIRAAMEQARADGRKEAAACTDTDCPCYGEGALGCYCQNHPLHPDRRP